MISYLWRVYFLGKKITKINKNISRPDVVIGSSVHLLAVLAAYWLSKYYKAKFVMEVRDLWPQTLIDMGISRWHPFIMFLSILERFLYKKSEKIISLLPKAYEYITSFGIPKNKIVWISNGVDLKIFKPVGLVRKEKTQNFIIIYSGAIVKANNLEVVVKAAEILQKNYKNIKFLLIGDGPEKPRLIKMIENKKLKNIKFQNPLPKVRVVEFISRADALLLLLRGIKLYNYGLCLNKLFDYLASARPIIHSSNSINNPVEEARAGITVPPDNPEKLAEAIVKLYKMSPEEREKMGKRGREYIEKYYNIPFLVDKLENVIKELTL